ncbi:FecR domain-containing protein [Sphingobacterium sp. InxBP1]|uniref:FecR family protein n=1 Tax=Sphingobacterium sp. InxBP1 TaxID=2870328 RepID=UPI0022437B77|nr:FecR family protein [Sphingobacterium sp. InxBP1]MCW8311220.1 FecR domain-containing protein [Sphingobacterium sp. InxBP1]
MIETDKIVLAELASLLLKEGKLSVENEAELRRLLEKYPVAKDTLRHRLAHTDVYVPFDLRRTDLDQEWRALETKYKERQNVIQRPRYPLWAINRSKLAGIAAAFVLVFICLWLWKAYFPTSNYLVPDKVYGQKNDILPGENGAILRISGHGNINLLNNRVDQQLIQGIELKDGKLVYTDLGNKESNPIHSLIVPKRSTIALTLSDGTRVWVNSESELTYKAGFDKNERKVKLKGEAYFEVAKDADRPFIVEANDLRIQAIGTAFDINSYTSNASVSLTEGRVKVHGYQKEIVIDAGNVAKMLNDQLVSYPLKDAEEATAWKDGYFYFKNKNMQQILDELSRWYGVKIETKIMLDKQRYEGGIKKDVTLAEVCNLLKDLTGYQFCIDRDKLTVSRPTINHE